MPSTLNRRRVMQQAALALGALGLEPATALLQQPLKRGMKQPMPPQSAPGQRRPLRANTLDALKLPSFVDPLPLPQLLTPQPRPVISTEGAHLRRSGETPVFPSTHLNTPYYRIDVHEVSHSFHRDLPPARQWSYGEGPAPVLIEAHSNQPILVDWHNRLPPQHILPLAGPMHGMEYLQHAPPTRMVTHLHGGRTPSISDGYPEDWFGPGHSKLDYYPNGQAATALWLHDHAMGVSRLNVFAGLMGWYIIRDDAEAALNLPTGAYELPLLLYDRSFTPDGQLYYPNPPDEGAWAQEYLGDAMIVNGKLRPFHEVEPRLYRLRIANTANSRFFALAFSNGQSFQVIGSDQGLLAAPVEMKRLVLAPAERTDILVDFTHAAGKSIRLTSDPFDLLEFRVAKPQSSVASTPGGPSFAASSQRVGSAATAVAYPAIVRTPESTAIRTRIMTLNEFDGDNGEPMVMLLNRKHWVEPCTEFVHRNTTEIWSLLNLTQDIHPIHLHMVRFQILDRQSFSTYTYLSDNKIQLTGPVLPPPAHELGWKDVVQCPPETITRIIVKFEGYTGRYLWHCHILEHEANDMMRPYVVLA